MCKMLCIRFAFKLLVLLSLVISVDCKKKKKRPDFNKEHLFWEPRDEPVNHTAVDEMSRIT